MPSEVISGFFLFSPCRVSHYVPVYSSLVRHLLILPLSQPQYHSHKTPPTASVYKLRHFLVGVTYQPCHILQSRTPLPRLAGRRCNNSVQKNAIRVHVLVFIEIPTAQPHLLSLVRHRVGYRTMPVTRRGRGFQLRSDAHMWVDIDMGR